MLSTSSSYGWRRTYLNLLLNGGWRTFIYESHVFSESRADAM